MPKHINDMTPAELIEAAELMLSMYEHALPHCSPNVYTFALRHPTRLDAPFSVLAYAPGHGFYVGGILYAFTFVPPLTIDISGLKLNDGTTPVPEMMRLSAAIQEGIEDTRAHIARMKAENNV